MHYDIVVVGGGLVGASFAALLKKTSLKIALIDNSPIKAKFIKQSLWHEAKALALSLGSIQQFQKLSLWHLLQPFAEAIKEVQVSQKGRFGLTRILALDYHVEALGYVINADYLNQILNESLESSDNITILKPDEVIKILTNEEDSKQTSSLSIQLKSGLRLTTSLLVAADGSESTMRTLQGIQASCYDYQQTALSVNLVTTEDHHNIAYERFVDQQIIAILPFGKKQVKCIWVLSKEDNLKITSNTDEWLMRKIEEQMGRRIGKILNLSHKLLYPLKSVIADTVYKRNFVSIGNASQTLHPVGAQGFNLGLRDAICLAKIIEKVHLNNGELGSLAILQSYAKQRKVDQEEIAFFTHQMATARNPKLHQLGILLSEWISPIKHYIAAKGMKNDNFL